MGWFPIQRTTKAAAITEPSPAATHLFPGDQVEECDSSPICRCFSAYYAQQDRTSQGDEDQSHGDDDQPILWPDLDFHRDRPSQTRRSWDIVCEVIDTARRKQTRELILGRAMDRSDYKALNTLPDSIGSLIHLEKLQLYGSSLSSIPPAIGQCSSLQEFIPYTSYRLHWFPYELKNCPRLQKSCISTRALYGNYKFRPPFPDLKKWRWKPSGQDSRGKCSVCGTEGDNLDQYWVSQAVATDVIPMLASVCDDDCLRLIGPGAEGYVATAHRGGAVVAQPTADEMG